MPDKIVQVMPIEISSRYILIISSLSELSTEQLEAMETLGRELEKWWASDQKFFVLVKDAEIDIKFEKVDEDEGED